MDIQTKIGSLAQEYGITDEKEISGIISIFTHEAIQESLSNTEDWRKRKIIIYLAVATTMLFLFAITGWGGFGAILIICTILLLGSFRGATERGLKTLLISRFLSLLYENIKYSTGPEYAFPIDEIKSGNFLKTFDQIDQQEDTIDFLYQNDNKTIRVRGMELFTSKIQNNRKQKKRGRIIAIGLNENIQKRDFWLKKISG